MKDSSAKPDLPVFRPCSGIFSSFTCIAALIAVCACDKIPGPEYGGYGESASSLPREKTELVLSAGSYDTRAISPDEDLFTDFNIFIFNEDGLMEEHIYADIAQMHSNDDGDWAYDIQLLEGCRYSIYVCANTGFRLACRNLSELLGYRFHIAYPDDYSIGMAMSGIRHIEYAGESEIRVPLKRAMAKISLNVDRSKLDDGIEFKVVMVRICNCPRNIRLFGDSGLDENNGSFASGFSRTDLETDPLNINTDGRVSGDVSLYLLENLQGKPLGEITDYADKVFEDGDSHERLCSYLEITAEYISADYHSRPGEGLVYRHYLGEGPSDFNVERNCHYHITVCPEGTGISGTGWRVDKSGLEPSTDT